jgi:hypothetical protein
MEIKIPESFNNAMNDIVVGKIVSLETALERPYDSVVSYLEIKNHILETANDELAKANKKMEETLFEIWQCFEMRHDIYFEDWYAVQAFAHKAKNCLEEIGSELIKEERNES